MITVACVAFSSLSRSIWSRSFPASRCKSSITEKATRAISGAANDLAAELGREGGAAATVGGMLASALRSRLSAPRLSNVNASATTAANAPPARSIKASPYCAHHVIHGAIP